MNKYLVIKKGKSPAVYGNNNHILIISLDPHSFIQENFQLIKETYKKTFIFSDENKYYLIPHQCLPLSTFDFIYPMIKIYSHINPTQDITFENFSGGATCSDHIQVGILSGSLDQIYTVFFHELGHAITYDLMNTQSEHEDYGASINFLSLLETNEEKRKEVYYLLPQENLANSMAQVLIKEFQNRGLLHKDFVFEL